MNASPTLASLRPEHVGPRSVIELDLSWPSRALALVNAANLHALVFFLIGVAIAYAFIEEANSLTWLEAVLAALSLLSFVPAVTAWFGLASIEAALGRRTFAGLVIYTGISVSLAIWLIANTNWSLVSKPGGATEGLFLVCYFAVVGILGTCAELYLRRARISAGPLSELAGTMERSAPNLEPQTSVRAKNIRRARMYTALGAVVILLAIVADALLPSTSHSSGRGFSWIIGFGFLCLLRARENFQPDFQALVSTDRRRPVLLLRSFAEDAQLTTEQAMRAFFDLSLETRVTPHFNAFGPFVAVQATDKNSFQIGATRVALKDSKWQETVSSLMLDAQTIVVLMGTTRWVKWELAKASELGIIPRMVVVFPKTKTWLPWSRRGIGNARVAVLRECFERTIWEDALSQIAKPQLLRAISFEPDGSIFAVTARPHTRDACHLAAIVAHLRLLQRRGNVVEGPSRLSLADLTDAIGEATVQSKILSDETDDELMSTSWSIRDPTPRDNIKRAVAALTPEEKQRILDVLASKPVEAPQPRDEDDTT